MPERSSSLAKKVVVVTGGAKGIGEAAAQAFLRAKARVAILDMDRSRASSDNCLTIRCDVSDSESVVKAFKKINRKWGGVDILVNNAGIQTYGTVTETDDALWDRTINVNLKGAFICAREALRTMAEKGGVIINVSSVQAFVSQPNVAAYTTAKTALLGLTRSIAVDYAPKVRCVAVCPGTIDTPMLRKAVEESACPQDVLDECIAMHPAGRIGNAGEVADLILFLCSNSAAFITGQYIRIDGGLGIRIAGSRKHDG